MAQNLDGFARWLKARQPRLEVRDEDLVERFWRVHPRFQFLKSLPWGWNVLDIGAGHGGLTHWRSWLKPDRADLNLYGVDRNPGEFRELYAGWETLDLDREMPNFAGVDFNGVIASHLIEYLDAPERLIAWLAERVKPGARVYLEWTGPSSLDLPGRDQLSQHGIEVLTSNFTDDRERKEAPALASVEAGLGEAGFDVIASGAIDLGILGEELFARAADRNTRSMGYWSLTRSSLYTVAIKSDDARPAVRERRATVGPHAGMKIPAELALRGSTSANKQKLVQEFGVAEGFRRHKQILGLAESDRIERKPVANLYEFAKQHGAVFHEIDPSVFAVACLIDACVRGGSELVQAGDRALFDGAAAERPRLDGDFDRDPAVFHAEAGAAWVIASDDPISMAELEEGFLPLRATGGDIADMPESVSRYIGGRNSGALPPVPVLINAGITATQREAVQRVLPPGTAMIEISPSATTRVRRLWCTPRRPAAQGSALEHYVRLSEAVPGFARNKEAWELARASFVLPPDAVIVEIGAFMGSGTILLAGARKLRGSGLVHVVDPFDGSGEPFSVPVYQRMLGEAGGGSLREHFQRHLRGAGLSDWVEVHQGRATDIAAHWTTPVDMIFFDGDQSRAGVRGAYDSWSPFLKPGGTIIVHNSAPGHRPEQDGSRVLVEEEIHPARYSDIRLIHSLTVARNPCAPAPRMFSYWDKPDLSPVQPALDDWQSHFPEFTIFGDPDVEPIIEELLPQHLDTFRSIRIPTCKSDLALLLLLYKHGGLYVDCHCGVRDPAAIRELLASLDRWDLILYDKDRREAPRADREIYPLNSVLLARPQCRIILAAAKTAFTNLLAHRSVEREHGFRPYHIAALSGPDIFSEVLFSDPSSSVSVLKPEWEDRIRFVQEGGSEPIKRYRHYGYRLPGLHWSERQKAELLFV